MATYIIDPGRSFRRPVGPFRVNYDSRHALGLVGFIPLTAWSMATQFLKPRDLLGTGEWVPAALAGYGGTVDGGSAETAASGSLWTCANDAAGPFNDYTVSAWVKLRNATPSDAAKTGMFCNIGSVSQASHYPYSDGYAYIGTLKNGGSNAIREVFPPLASVNRADWHLVTVTAAPTWWGFYQNGQQAFGTPNGSVNWYPATSTMALFGDTASYKFDGWMTDFRLWNRALSPAEVWSLYDPPTRWGVYWQPSRRIIFDVGAAPAGFKAAWARRQPRVIGAGVI